MNTFINEIRQLIAGCLDLTADISQWLTRLPELREAVCLSMRDEVFGGADDRLVERRIQQIQHECIQLMDLLQKHQEIPDALMPVQQAAFDCLESILACIEKHHSRFFDQQATVPLSYFQHAAAGIGKKMNILRAGLRQLKTDVDLLDIILDSLSDFLKSGGCTYEQLIYRKELQNSLISLCGQMNKETDAEVVNAAVTEHLFYLRFNSCALVNYYKRKIAAEITELFNIQEQYEHLCLYEKQMSVQQERAICCFEPLNGNIKSLLQDYIQAELKYLQKRLSCFSLNEQPADLKKRLQSSNYRIKVSLSADALAYLTRLFVDAGIIISKPKTQLMAFISRNMETPGAGPNLLSPVSLMSKYKQVVQSTAKAVRAALMRMLALLEKRFGLGGS